MEIFSQMKIFSQMEIISQMEIFSQMDIFSQLDIFSQMEIFSQMDSALLSEIFLIFNVSGDGSMNIQEFVLCWNMWIKKVKVLKIYY